MYSMILCRWMPVWMTLVGLFIASTLVGCGNGSAFAGSGAIQISAGGAGGGAAGGAGAGPGGTGGSGPVGSGAGGSGTAGGGSSRSGGSGTSGSGSGTAGTGGTATGGSTGGGIQWPVWYALFGMSDGDQISVQLDNQYSSTVIWYAPYPIQITFLDPTTPTQDIVAFPAGTPYTLVVTGQPVGKSCTVAAPTGVVARGLVVAIHCVPKAAPTAWLGRAAALSASAQGELMGDPVRARSGYALCQTPDGGLWLYGGATVGFADSLHSDLWVKPANAVAWTLVGTEDRPNSAGHHGSAGVSDERYAPGALVGGELRVDGDGTLRLAGGTGPDAGGAVLPSRDIWRFDPRTRQWAWMGQQPKPGIESEEAKNATRPQE